MQLSWFVVVLPKPYCTYFEKRLIYIIEYFNLKYVRNLKKKKKKNV